MAISNNLSVGCYPDKSATPSGTCSVRLSESVTSELNGRKVYVSLALLFLIQVERLKIDGSIVVYYSRYIIVTFLRTRRLTLIDMT